MNSATVFSKTGGFTGTATEAAARQATQSEAQVDQIQGAAAETGRLIDELEMRLAGVLRARSEQTPVNAVGSPPEEYLVPRADHIRTVRKELDSQARTLRSILERLEA